MTASDWVYGVYLMLGALFAGHCMIEVETERVDPMRGKPVWFLSCVGAALVLTVIWLPVVIYSLTSPEGGHDGE